MFHKGRELRIYTESDWRCGTERVWLARLGRQWVKSDLVSGRLLVQKHLDSGHFKMTMRFLAGLTKLANIPPDITKRLMESDNTQLTYFHFLFEAKDNSVTTRTLSADETIISPQHSWTPLDYYVTGHAISHSKCPWSLHFSGSSIDDENFELFCHGCAAGCGTTNFLLGCY